MWKVVIPDHKDIRDLRCDTLDDLCVLAQKLLKEHAFIKAYCITGLGFCAYFSRHNTFYVGSA